MTPLGARSRDRASRVNPGDQIAALFLAGARKVNLYSFAIIFVGVVLTAAGQLLFKAGANNLHAVVLNWLNPIRSGLTVVLEPHICLGFTCFVVSAGVWLVALSRVPVSVAYPMLSIGYVINAIAAYYLFGEALSQMKIVGISVIMIGVMLVSKG